MPDLDFQITGVETAEKGLTPILQFQLRITALEEAQAIQALMLNTQIQFEPAQRAYSATEKEKLVELFGAPDRWGQTLRNRLLAQTTASIGGFRGQAETKLQVPCSYDLNIASTKYFYALEAGELSLLFLFSGSIFWTTSNGRLQVEPIPWNKECRYRMQSQVWRELMESHFADSSWITLRRDVFDELCAYKRRNALPNWEQAIESLLRKAEPAAAAVELPPQQPAAIIPGPLPLGNQVAA
jgi:hypothetical protein